VQAVPLVVSAAVAQLLFGDFKLAVAVPLAIGSLPGVYLGARISSRIRSGPIRPILGVVLVASGLKLLDASNVTMLVTIGVIVVALPPLWIASRRSLGLPALPPRQQLSISPREVRPPDDEAEPSSVTRLAAAPGIEQG
jgi:uncharacterized protein